MKLSHTIDRWGLRESFVIAGARYDEIPTLTVELWLDEERGWGEAAGVDYLGETPESMREQLESDLSATGFGAGLASALQDDAPLPLEEIQNLLPPGGARNALDCALWDLRCKRSGRSIWSWLDLEPRPVTTAFTLSLDAPVAMAAAVRRAAIYPVLKLKLDAELLVDANGSWTMGLLADVAPALVEQRVALVEQPLPAYDDAALAGWRAPVPLCADESCQWSADLDVVATRYQVVNVKLDKCGGLTDALRMVERCRALGLELMVGNMLGSSLAMAPAFVIAQWCRWVDLDGPLLQRTDREHALRYDGARLMPPDRWLWG